ncbi:MAG TPA: hypothetical protein VJ183_06695 [Chloroflexia bacterium]|nr:hypothetical protein [Chloroflexia bacterium]
MGIQSVLAQATVTVMAVSQPQVAQATGNFDLGALVSWVANVLGILAAIGSFIAWRRTRKTAKEVQAQARKVRETFHSIDILTIATEAKNLLANIQRMHLQRRGADKHTLLNDYATLRIKLIEIRRADPKGSNARKTQITEALAEFTSIWDIIAAATPNANDILEDVNFVPYNRIIDRLIETLTEIVVETRQQMGEQT